MTPPRNSRRTLLALVLVLVAVSAVWVVRCIRTEKPDAKPPQVPGNPPITTPDKPVQGSEFKEPGAGGVRRFTPPRAEEVTAVSASPDGALLAAVTAKNLYLFDAALK